MNSFFYRLTVSYKGTRYFGWQIQKGPEKTIQGELLKTLSVLCKSSDIKLLGSGRTDAGVHAIGQIFRAEIPIELPLVALSKGMNALLPSDIYILKVEACDKSFRPIHQAYWKEYNYVFSMKKTLDPFFGDYIGHCRYDLDIELMKEACKIFIGTHDFCNFYCTGTKIHSTVRTIFHCDLKFEQPSGFFSQMIPPYYIFQVVGDGFLKQMVRLMVGALWSIGQKKLPLPSLREALLKKFPRKLGVVAPPQGLYLKEVNYLFPYSSINGNEITRE